NGLDQPFALLGSFTCCEAITLVFVAGSQTPFASHRTCSGQVEGLWLWHLARQRTGFDEEQLGAPIGTPGILSVLHGVLLSATEPLEYFAAAIGQKLRLRNSLRNSQVILIEVCFDEGRPCLIADDAV